MTAPEAMLWSARIAAVSLTLLGVELLANKKASRSVQALALGLLAAAIWAFACGPGWPFILLTVLVCALSVFYRGSYCGGADTVMLYACIALAVGGGSPRVGVALLSALAVTSYFVSGLVKARRIQWWSGQVMAGVMQNSFYSVPLAFKKLAMRPLLLRLASWAVILFELSFAAVLVSRWAVAPLVAMGVAFHIMVFWIFGLNRFFWTWVITYPALFALHQMG